MNTSCPGGKLKHYKGTLSIDSCIKLWHGFPKLLAFLKLYQNKTKWSEQLPGCNACTFVDGKKTGRAFNWCYLNNNQCSMQSKGRVGHVAAYKLG